MPRLGPFAWGTIYFGIFSITAAIVFNAAVTAATTIGDAEEVYNLAGWLAAAALGSFLLGVAGEVVRGGWQPWRASEGQDARR